jgi:uncharacterized protein (DUF885 family)
MSHDQTNVAPSSEAQQDAANAALNRFFAHYYARRPVQATFTGIHDFDAALPDWSPDGLDALPQEMRELRRALAASGLVDDIHVRRFPDEVDLALADGFLEIQLAEHESGHFLQHNPALWTGEAIFSIVALVTRDFAPIEQRLASAAARLRAIPAFLSQSRHVLRASPDAWRSRALRECAAGARLVGERLPEWWTELTASNGLPASLRLDLDLAARGAARALTDFSEWLERDVPVAPAARVSAGTALLELLLRRGHWCQTPIDHLLDEARAALDSAGPELDRRARRVAPGGWNDAQARIAGTHPTREDYLPRFDRIWHACRDLAIGRDLVSWPDAPLRYVEIPRHTREAAPSLYYLFYRSPAPFDRIPVYEYVVTPIGAELAPEEQERRLRAANDSAITLNHVVHHGALGHHVQNYYATHGRSRVGQIAAVDGASRIGMFSGGTLAEGWACYACDLAEEMNFLTPLDLVAQQHTRVRLLARAVADLELHTGRRTLDQTAAFYRECAMMAPEAAHAEAVKNSMFPGAAVMYWLGTRDLHALREACRMRAGAAFTLRAFHDQVLSYGAIPVPLIARLMMETTA